jgi:beta-lactamase class A
VDFQAALVEQARRFRGRLGVAIRYLPDGPAYALRSSESFYPASVIKVPILVEVFAQAAEGRLDLDARISLTNQDRREGSGVLAALSDGLSLTVYDLAELMIVVSDNTAAGMLARLVGAANVNDRMRTLGLAGTRVGGWWDGDARNTEQSATTPDDMRRLFELLWRGELVSASASARMLAILGRQQFMGLARYLPVDDLSEAEGRRNSRVLIASKSGEVNGVRNDVGLITARTEMGSRSYIVSIFMNDVEDDRLWTAENPAMLAIGDISRLAYRHLLEDLLSG